MQQGDSPKTPVKSPNEVFSPIILPVSPADLVNQRNITGLPRVVRDIVADVYNNIQKWNEKHVAGAAILQQIAIIKSESTEQLPSGLETLVKSLYDIVQVLSIYCNALIFLKNQMMSLIRLQKCFEPLFATLTIEEMAELVRDIASAYVAEFKAKEYVLENIAYSKTKQEVLFFSASWAHQVNIPKDINFKLEALLVETGHRRIV